MSERTYTKNIKKDGKSERAQEEILFVLLFNQDIPSLCAPLFVALKICPLERSNETNTVKQRYSRVSSKPVDAVCASRRAFYWRRLFSSWRRAVFSWRRYANLLLCCGVKVFASSNFSKASMSSATLSISVSVLPVLVLTSASSLDTASAGDSDVRESSLGPTATALEFCSAVDAASIVSGEESGRGGEEESAEDDDDAGLSGASPEVSEEKERTRELSPRLRTVGVATAAAACAVEKVRVRRLPEEGRARRGWRGDDARPNDEEDENEDKDEDEDEDENEDENKDEGGSLKRGDDRRRFARGLAQRNLVSIIGRRV